MDGEALTCLAPGRETHSPAPQNVAVISRRLRREGDAKLLVVFDAKLAKFT